MAVEKANIEYQKYRKQNRDELSEVEKDFLEAVKKTQKLIEGKKK